jgi:hypothetical protein
MCRCSLLAAALVLIPSFAGAQATREDGIRALVLGNYEAAVRILRPLAENTPQPDPVAQFFMAILYDTGRGVQRNSSRACGLFLDAVKPANPFMEQSSQLSNLAREQFGPMASQVCVSGATWREVPPATFTLGPNHSVVIKDSSITVAYNGTENRIMTGLLPGAVSMPMRYTPLDVSRPVAVRRHFLQWFVWVPDVPAAPSTWSLGWILHEVVGGQFTTITGERSLAIVSAAEPPASYDLARLAHVRVNADGEAEWVIAGSTNPRSAVVPWKDPR